MDLVEGLAHSEGGDEWKVASHDPKVAKLTDLKVIEAYVYIERLMTA